MNNRQKIIKAIGLIRSVEVSVRERAPNGVSPRDADLSAFLLTHARANLEEVLNKWPEPEAKP